MQTILGQHHLLLASSSRKSAAQHAHFFFEHNDLVRYDSVIIASSAIIPGTDPDFFNKIEEGLKANRQAINSLVRELQAEGAADPQTWATLQQGYATKLLHTAIHLLDGFFGVDSALYNLIEHTHQVTAPLLSRIQKNPGQYWLVPVSGVSNQGNANRVPALRPFGREK